MPADLVGGIGEESGAEPAEHLLRVTGLASGGEGVGRLEDGRVVFVEGAVTGDYVALTAVEDRGIC
jgi:tRNA/tmRNA/rRNA uracil-C5-methylase (TrmA/RlmC/RlmD family)